MTPVTETTPTAKKQTNGNARVLRADARRNREAVLAAAREGFGEQGLDCQMEDIARAAGVGVGTVYRHFPNKEKLVDALVQDRFERLAERTAEALKEDDPWEAWCDLMRWSAKLQADDRGLSELLASRPLLGEAAAAKAGLVELSDKLMRKAKRAGKMRKDLMVEDIPTMICGLSAVTGAADGSLSAMNWERFLEVMLDGMRAPGSAKRPPPRARINQPR
ncbi:MAG TPA: TetR/AcrR family transcriptional regulator [Solirubrobacterales bacterium]|nr:TetR/AcrR family transcriptional regulator [Solirubrobacterales bacterium]